MHLMDTEMKKARELMGGHNCPLAAGVKPNDAKREIWMLDSRFRLEATPTSIGTRFVLACECGQKCDVTDYDLW